MGLEQENTMIITYIDENYEENLEFDFLESLRKRAKYKGKILVMDYGLSEDIVKKLSKQYDVIFERCKKDLAVFSQRYRDIPKAIEKYCNNIKSIMLIDGGDIWFQKDIMPIFERTQNKVGCVAEEIVIGIDEWTAKCMANLSTNIQSIIMLKCHGTHVKNSGMIAGPKEKIHKLIKDIYKDICNSGIEYFGIDQIMFNYEFAMLKEDEKIVLDNQFNYVLVTNKEGYYISDNNIYKKNDDTLVAVVHNAGGAWRMLKRPFSNKNTNYEQYVLENVTKINLDNA